MQGVSPMGWLWWVGGRWCFGILEMLSLDLVLIMFAGGCLAGAVAWALGAPLGVQILVAALTSVLLLATLRPFLLKRLRERTPLIETNSAALVGQEAVVVSTVTVEGGRVKLNGEVWSARVDAAQAIPPGTEVRVVAHRRRDRGGRAGRRALTHPHCPRSTARAAVPALTSGGLMDNLGSGTIAAYIVGGLILLFVIVALVRAVRIVPQATAVVVERLGRYSRTLDAGLHLLIPFVDRVRAGVDLREQVVSFPPQPVITSDNLVVSIDTVIYFQVTEPKSAVYEIANYIQGIEQLTVTTLRNVVGSMDLEQTLTSRDQINGQLRGVLDEATGKWGVRVNRVELKSIDPPDEHQGLDGAADARRA